jgi:hypothetical protein
MYSTGDCVVPRIAHVALAGAWTVSGVVFLTTELFLVSSSQSDFYNFDKEKQAIIAVRILFAVSGVLAIFPLLLNKANEWNDENSVMKNAFMVAQTSVCWLIIVVYRNLRRGFSNAFALSPGMAQMLRNVNGVRTVHLALWLAFVPYINLQMVESRSNSAREAYATVFLLAAPLAVVSLLGWAIWLAAAALRSLPHNSQSAHIRKKISAFKQVRVREARAVAVAAILIALPLILPAYTMVLMWYGSLVAIFVPAASNVMKLCARSKKLQTAKQIHTLHVAPAISTAKSLREWEAEGRESERPSDTNLAAEVREVGVLGVSFALLKALADEKDMPYDWTMAQVYMHSSVCGVVQCVWCIGDGGWWMIWCMVQYMHCNILLYNGVQVCNEVIKPLTLLEGRRKQSRTQSILDQGRDQGRDGTDSGTGGRIKPTAHRHCSYAALIGKATDGEGRAYVSTATRFVSYAW